MTPQSSRLKTVKTEQSIFMGQLPEVDTSSTSGSAFVVPENSSERNAGSPIVTCGKIKKLFNLTQKFFILFLELDLHNNR